MTGPVRSTTIQQHVLTRATGERTLRPYLIETSYMLLSGDYEDGFDELEPAAQMRWIFLIDRIHAAEIALAMLDAHVRAWAEQALVTTGSIEDLAGVIRRAIRVAHVREDARVSAIENASHNFSRDGESALRETPHKIIGVTAIANRMGIDRFMWDTLGVAWCETYDQSYADCIGELMEVRRG